jgi:hypothetical protein
VSFGKRLARPALVGILALSGLGSAACNVGRDDGAAPAAGNNNATAAAAAVKLMPKAATASNTGAGNVAPANVFDGKADTSWVAGDAPLQWIQLDLGELTSLSKVRLHVNQTPGGPTTHQIHGGPAPDQLQLINTLEGTTQDNQWLESNSAASGVRYLRITTVKSPSWVAWREIEVYK